MPGHKWEDCKSPEELMGGSAAIKKRAEATLRFLRDGVVDNPYDVGTWIHRPGQDNNPGKVSLITNYEKCNALAGYIAEKGGQDFFEITQHKIEGGIYHQLTVNADRFERAMQEAQKEIALDSGHSLNYRSPANMVVHGDGHHYRMETYGWEQGGNSFLRLNPQEDSVIIAPCAVETDVLKHAQELCPNLHEGAVSMNPGGGHNTYQVPESERQNAIETLTKLIATPSVGAARGAG